MPISKPNVNISLLPANLTISNGPQRVLFVGQMKTGTATAGTLVQNIGNSQEWDALFGANSMLASMIRAFRAINEVTAVDAICLADAGSSTAATGTVAFTGPATAAGTLFVTVGSGANNRYQLDVTSGLTATQLGNLLVSALAADGHAVASGVNTTGSVALTAAHTGTEGNTIPIRVEGTVAGVGVTVTAFASGATNPTLTNLLALVSDTRYQTVVWPTTYATTEVLTNFLNPRFNVLNDIMDGVMVQTLVDTKTNHLTALASLNNSTQVYISLKAVNDALWKGNPLQEMPYVVSSQFAAIRSLRLTEGANIASYITSTTGQLDTIGGPALASLPYFNTPINQLLVVPVGKDWTKAEVEVLAAAGASCIGNNQANNKVILGDFVTTYKTDNAGNPDVTFKYLNNVDTASAVREYFFINIKKQFSQTRLTLGDLVPNRAIANPMSIGAYMDKLFLDLSSTDFVLLQGGEEARIFFKKNRSVTVDLTVGSATIPMLVPIVTQLRSVIIPMQIAFSTT